MGRARARDESAVGRARFRRRGVSRPAEPGTEVMSRRAGRPHESLFPSPFPPSPTVGEGGSRDTADVPAVSPSEVWTGERGTEEIGRGAEESAVPGNRGADRRGGVVPGRSRGDVPDDSEKKVTAPDAGRRGGSFLGRSPTAEDSVEKSAPDAGRRVRLWPGRSRGDGPGNSAEGRAVFGDGGRVAVRRGGSRAVEPEEAAENVAAPDAGRRVRLWPGRSRGDGPDNSAGGRAAFDDAGRVDVRPGGSTSRAQGERAAGPYGGADPRGSRSGRFVRDVLVQSGVQDAQVEQVRRLPDTLREAGEHALHAVRKWSDPRERELRRRRRVRRRSLRLGTASGLTALGTAGLVIISAPAWAVIVVGGGAAALVTGAAVTTRRYLELRRNPLPEAAFVPRKLPPVRSAARVPIARLVRAERAFHTVGQQIVRGGRLPGEELDDTLETAGSGAAALHALAADLVAMEKAAELVGQVNSVSGPALGTHIRAAASRLEDGVAEYEELVAAAGRILAVPESPALPDDLGWAMTDLRGAADRLDGWAQALADLAER
ncbi:hypothetical protein [Nocardia sp. BMG51109]|uniref:phage shock envelope stress response protein PspM n=1 Tax=Nocardia sp. BMG51109 TaxID=1056816 RepID=UPI001E3F4772|nr:hypothetical protein [Nocardia sp. BMG51109]